MIKSIYKHCENTTISGKIGNTDLARIGRDRGEISTKYLGMHTGDSLSWKNHIVYVNSKITDIHFDIKQG